MARITLVQIVYNNRRFIEPVFSAIFNQTYKDMHVIAVISGNEDGGKELLQDKFPQVEIVDPGYNIGFSAGHNLVFEKETSDFFQLVNPDLVLEPDYVEKMLKAFEDPTVGAATGKLYQVERDEISNAKFQISKGPEKKYLDTTGVTISKSGRARDRGQHEEDQGQYDSQTVVDAVSGAGPMYRAEALEGVKLPLPLFRKEGGGPTTSLFKREGRGGFEYFDQDFHSYWEDVDLAWRMRNKGWKCVFVPSAVGYHGRGAGSSKNGYSDVLGFIKHHKQLSPRVRQLNYKNHILMYIKNSPWLYPQFFVREFFMFGYILLFEILTLKILPELFRQLPGMWKKRRQIKRPL